MAWSQLGTLAGPPGETGPEGPEGDPGATGSAGAAGAPGTRWFAAAGPPTSGAGATAVATASAGDFYLDTDTGDFYKLQ